MKTGKQLVLDWEATQSNAQIDVLPIDNGNGFVDIITHIQQMAEKTKSSVEEEARLFKLTGSQCDKLGIPRRKEKQRDEEYI